MIQNRWPDGRVQCPYCGSENVIYLQNARLWYCKAKHPRQKFSLKVGTVFEDSPIGLEKWLPAVWMLVNCKNGASSWEIHRALGVTQKTAWFMLHRIRLAMQTGSFRKLLGEVEADETFIGGKARNMHADKRKVKIQGSRRSSGKMIVMGLLERHGGEVCAKVVPTARRHVVQNEVRQQVEQGSEVYTDALTSYEGLSDAYRHLVIDHAEAYAKGKVHTNGLENFWSLLKRGLREHLRERRALPPIQIHRRTGVQV